MSGKVERILEGRSRDLGGFTVRRVLPAAERQQGGRLKSADAQRGEAERRPAARARANSERDGPAELVGPFIFFDQMGPVEFPAGGGIDVRPHPHIGLATVTYLFEGEILHRDSLGYVQAIRPGAVNWMTAGRGIVHSERSSPESRRAPQRLHGIQSWIALPTAHEEHEPCFQHHPADSLPRFEHGGAQLCLIAGRAFDRTSPVEVFSELFYLDAAMPAGARFALPDGLGERALYIADGELEVAGDAVPAGRLLLLSDDGEVALAAPRGARVMCFGGAPLDGERHIWWNLVSSSQARIERAKADWRAERFAAVPGETERIPLPES